MDEETEAQGREELCPRHTSGKGQSWALNPTGPDCEVSKFSTRGSHVIFSLF